MLPASFYSTDDDCTAHACMVLAVVIPSACATARNLCPIFNSACAHVFTEIGGA